MHRFYLPPEHCRPPALSLTGGEAHHAHNVLRVRLGDRVVVLDGAGTEYACEVRECRRGQVELRVTETQTRPLLPWQITLVQALPKGKLIESIIQKATELGVARVVPLVTERVVARFDEDEAEDKRSQWQSVAIEAIKQCGSAWLPQVVAPATPGQFLQRKLEFDLALVGSLQPDGRHPRSVFREFEQLHGCRPKSICVWVGPEGDFTLAELELIQSAGARPVTLGRLVLRTETAAIYCLSVVNYELGSPKA